MTSSVKAKQPEEPPNIRKWNWGAFLLGSIWGKANNTKFPANSFNPIINMRQKFDRGRNGNALAWRNMSWEDAEHFETSQRKWAYIGFATVTACGLVFTVGLFSLINYIFLNSNPYKQTISILVESKHIQNNVGIPFDTSIITGFLKHSGTMGTADLKFRIDGPFGNAQIRSLSSSQGGIWEIECIRISTSIEKSEYIGDC